jgi:hypothetical protein
MTQGIYVLLISLHILTLVFIFWPENCLHFIDTIFAQQFLDNPRDSPEPHYHHPTPHPPPGTTDNGTYFV